MFTSTPISNDQDGHNHNNDEKVSSSSLLKLPEELRGEIYSYCLPKTLGLFAKTSRQAEQETAFLRLHHSAVNAEPESYEQKDETKLAAIAMLKRRPEFLFKTIDGPDHFGREIEASPYRAFLGTGDAWALKQVHEDIIAEIKDEKARAEAYAQTKVEFYTQFPDYEGPWPLAPDMPEAALYDKRNKEQIKQVKAQLKIIVEKISADPCTDGKATNNETTAAVKSLCQIFAPKEGEIIKTGLHFPLGILKEIYKVYDTQFDPWSYDQLAFFSREVIGGAESALSAVDGQSIKNGLANLDMKKGPDRRDGLFCRQSKGIPWELAPLIGKLGRTMFVDPYDGYSCFLSSAGYFDWYSKNGAARGRRSRRRGAVRGLLGLVVWRCVGQLMENKSRSLWQLLCNRPQSQHTVLMSRTARCNA